MTNPTRTRMDAVRSAEHLDALPEGTVIGWTEDTYPQAAVRQGRSWRDLNGPAPYSEGVMEDADPDSIRIVSVPIDALLTEDAIEAAADAAWVDDAAGWSARAAIRAAIGHVTGGAA